MLDFVLNGRAHGSVASQMMANNFDPGALRPFIGDDGRSYVSLATNKKDKDGKLIYNTVMLNNAQGSLLHEEWKYIDRTVKEAAYPKLNAWADLRAAGSLVIPQGMGKTIVETSRIKDITPAKISMDGIAVSDNDIVEGDTVGVPLPIIHKDCRFSARQIAVSRQGSLPLDTTMISMAARKVAEEVEKMTIGIGAGAGYKYGGYEIQGYTNFSDRITYELSDPSSGGWAPSTLITEIIEMRKSAEDVGYSGPFKMYVSSDFSALFDEDYSTTKGSNTLRQRILALDKISSIATLDYLTGFQILLVQLTPDVARAVVGMPLTALQWDQSGGMDIRIKVMAIMVPHLRSDFYNGTGIVHGTVVASS